MCTGTTLVKTDGEQHMVGSHEDRATLLLSDNNLRGAGSC